MLCYWCDKTILKNKEVFGKRDSEGGGWFHKKCLIKWKKEAIDFKWFSFVFLLFVIVLSFFFISIIDS